jgi:hypothetical protein
MEKQNKVEFLKKIFLTVEHWNLKASRKLCKLILILKIKTLSNSP